MQANGYLLPAEEAPNHPPPQSGEGRGSDEKGRVRQGGVISAVAVGHRQAALAVMCRG